MSFRRQWTKREDQVLKMLKEEEKLKKWSDIATKMRQEYFLEGRNGKQCRQRYHNHLQSGITKGSWTRQEQLRLLQLHNLFGNRWSTISKSLPGRRQSCIKNHFYSQFKGSIKRINMAVKEKLNKNIKPLKMILIHKIIELSQQSLKSKNDEKEVVYRKCKELKQRIMLFEEYQQVSSSVHETKFEYLLTQLIKDINSFSKRYKLKKKKKKQDQIEQKFKESQKKEAGKNYISQKKPTKGQVKALSALFSISKKTLFENCQFQFHHNHFSKNQPTQEKEMESFVHQQRVSTVNKNNHIKTEETKVEKQHNMINDNIKSGSYDTSEKYLLDISQFLSFQGAEAEIEEQVGS